MKKTIQILLYSLLLMAVLAATHFVGAEQVCYSHDSLGRLAGVIGPNSEAAFYEYDAVGNILRIRRESPAGPVNILSIDPPSGAPGTRVEIFGIGFSLTANQNQVSINGVSLPVVSVSGCTITVEVPSDSPSGQITVVTPLGTAVSSQVFQFSSILIPLITTASLVNGTVQFTTAIVGCSDPNLVWSVNGIVGGNSTYGTITPAGLYTAPAIVPAPAQVVIRAESLTCDGLEAETLLAIVEQNTLLVAGASVSYGTPVLASLPPNVVLHGASVAYGAAPIGPVPGAILHSVSVALAPVVTNMTPTSADRNTNFNLTVSGNNLSGAFEIEFHLPTGADNQIIVTNIVVNPTGTSLTADVSVLGAATSGSRVVVVKTPSGHSTYANTAANAFTVQ